jgi:rhodanese-related sulfurtransferase
MKKLLIPIMGLILLSACANGASVTKISAAKAKEMMESQDVIIVDVRTQAEYDEGYIPNAILIPNESIQGEPKELVDKDATILVYCRSGNRSAQAAKKLVDLGYTNVYDFGGIIDWPYEIVN